MHPSLSRRLALALLLAGGAALFVPRAGAQNQLASLQELDAAHTKHLVAIGKLQNGQQAPTKADQEAMDAEAKWLVYRFASTPPRTTKEMAKFQDDFEYFVRRVEDQANKKANREFVKQFGPLLVKRYSDLFDQDFMEYHYPIVNVAPTLPVAARMKDEAIAQYLVDLLTDKGKAKHDVIKRFAAQGLREYFPVTPLAEAEDTPDWQLKRKEKEVKYVDALVKFIERKPADKLPEPEQNAVRYLRREAIESLAQAQAPTVMLSKDGKEVEGPIAPILLKVLAPKSDLDPPPGLAERIEAAIGICEMKYSKIPDYDAEIAVYLVALLLHDMAIEYNKDQPYLKGDKKRPAQLPWKIHAKRLEEGLKDLVANSKNQPAEKKAKDLQAAISNLNILKSMQQSVLINQQSDLPQLRNQILPSLKPANKKVFKNVTKYVIDLE